MQNILPTPGLLDNCMKECQLEHSLKLDLIECKTFLLFTVGILCWWMTKTNRKRNVLHQLQELHQDQQ